MPHKVKNQDNSKEKASPKGQGYVLVLWTFFFVWLIDLSFLGSPPPPENELLTITGPIIRYHEGGHRSSPNFTILDSGKKYFFGTHMYKGEKLIYKALFETGKPVTVTYYEREHMLWSELILMDIDVFGINMLSYEEKVVALEETPYVFWIVILFLGPLYLALMSNWLKTRY